MMPELKTKAEKQKLKYQQQFLDENLDGHYVDAVISKMEATGVMKQLFKVDRFEELDHRGRKSVKDKIRNNKRGRVSDAGIIDCMIRTLSPDAQLEMDRATGTITIAHPASIGKQRSL